MKTPFTLVLFFVCNSVISQNYLLFTLPDSIVKNADAVIQKQHKRIELISQNKFTYRVEEEIIIFNQNADGFASPTIFYDKYNQINSVNIEYFNALGVSIKKVKKKDFKDYAAVDGFSLFNDDRVIHYEYTPINYPYTMVLTYEISSSNTAFIPDWYPIYAFNIGVISSSYEFINTAKIEYNKIEKNFTDYTVSEYHNEGNLKYVLANQIPIKEENLCPSIQNITPSVQIGLKMFSLSGVQGEADNWEEMGMWMHKNLLQSRNNLNESTKKTIKDLVKDIPNPKERAKIVYEYVQNKTRYISIQIGIGGWMPMYVDEVDKLGYGDCKALAFYTKSLLDEAEVPSYYSIVQANGNERVDIEKDLVSIQGNHAILVLPFQDENVILECTSQKLPFSENGSFTQDRDILAITPEGGKIIHTNIKKPEENYQKSNATLSIDSQGNTTVDLIITSFGNQLDDKIRLDGMTKLELDKFYKEHFPINNIDFKNILVQNNKNETKFEEQISFNAKNTFKILSDGNMVVLPNLLNNFVPIPVKEKIRKLPFQIDFPFKDDDEITFRFPENFIVNQLPNPIALKTKFGEYSVSYKKLDNNSISYKREFTIFKGNYSKDEYEDYRIFLKEVNKYDNTKILFESKK